MFTSLHGAWLIPGKNIVFTVIINWKSCAVSTQDDLNVVEFPRINSPARVLLRSNPWEHTTKQKLLDRLIGCNVDSRGSFWKDMEKQMFRMQGWVIRYYFYIDTH